MDMGGWTTRVQLACDRLAPLQRVVQGWHLRTDLAGLVKPVRCPGPAGAGGSLPGREFRARENGGAGVGNTTIGKGSNVMVVADGHGLPSGLSVDRAPPHESQLADATLATVRVPQQRGRPRTRPKALVADKAYDSHACRKRLRRRGLKPTIPTFERRQRRRPKRGRPIKVGASDRQRWNVERCFGWMENCRRVVVRYEGLVEHDKAFCLTAMILWSINLILK